MFFWFLIMEQIIGSSDMVQTSFWRTKCLESLSLRVKALNRAKCSIGSVIRRSSVSVTVNLTDQKIRSVMSVLVCCM